MLGKGLESLIPTGGYKKSDQLGSSSLSASSQPNLSKAVSQSISSDQNTKEVIEIKDNRDQEKINISSQSNTYLNIPNTPHINQPVVDNTSFYNTSKTINDTHNISLSKEGINKSDLVLKKNVSQADFNTNIQNSAFYSDNRFINSTEEVPILRDNQSFNELAHLEDVDIDYSRGQASVFQIEVDKIFPNPHQPRKHFDDNALNDLANSIREFGIIQPLVATKILKETEIGTEVTYQLIAGERRLMAAKRVGLRTVPVVIKRVGIERERLELSIIENIQRENLNPLEAARSYARLQDEFGLTQREIAIRMGKSRETIANTLRLLNLPSEIQKALEDGRINESHARLLLQIDDIKRQENMFQSILHSKPSVRELKATIKKGSFDSNKTHLNPELFSLQSKLEESLGTKAEISDTGGKGKIMINYYSPEELSALINRLSGEYL